MLTKQLYYTEPYLKELVTKIVKIVPTGLIFDESISYPEGGGQPGDRGTINGRPYRDTKLIDGEIVHLIDTEGFYQGDEVKLSLDWQHRYFFMKEHTAQHMLSGLMYSLFGIGTLSVHLGDEMISIETDNGEIDQNILLTLEDEVNDRIRQACKTRAIENLTLQEASALNLRRSIKVEDNVRIVCIDNVDRIACGGVHVADTSEIEEVCYVSSEIIRSHVRTFWKVADKAKEKRREDGNIVAKISQLLSSPSDKIVKTLETFIADKEALEVENRKSNQMIAALIMEKHKKEKAFISPIPLSSYITLLDEEKFIIYEGTDKAGWLYFGKGDFFKSISSLFGYYQIKGGGREPLFQGMVKKEFAQAFFNRVKELFDGK